MPLIYRYKGESPEMADAVLVDPKFHASGPFKVTGYLTTKEGNRMLVPFDGTARYLYMTSFMRDWVVDWDYWNGGPDFTNVY